MDEFLNLLIELNLTGMAARDLIAGEQAILKRLQELGPEVEGAEADEFDGLTERLNIVRDHLDQSKRVERAAVLSTATQRTTSTATTQRSQGNPLPIRRGIEARSEDPNDPVTNCGNRFSLSRAVCDIIAGKQLSGFEAECSREIAMRTGKTPEGFFMPGSIDYSPVVQRANVTTTIGDTLNQITVDKSLIGILSNKLAVSQFSPTILQDLMGKLNIPTQTAANTGYWVTEGSDVTDSNVTFGSISLDPKTLGATTTHTRKFLLLQNIATEGWLRSELERILRLELDRAIVNGSGSGAEPEGIIPNTNVETIAIGATGGALTWANVVKLETECAADNADAGNLGYLTNTKVRGAAKSILKFSSAGSDVIWQSGQNGNGEMNGYKAVASNQVPSNLEKSTSGTVLSALIFGNWSDLILAFWTGIDVIVNPYTGDKSGNVRITAHIDADIKLRRTQSFKKITDITT